MEAGMKTCILIPTHDNPRTIEAVVSGARARHPDVIVVDDGSGPAAREILARLDGVRVISHDRRRGKGAALRTGFRAARELGYTHAVTFDADGQHLPDDIPLLLEEIRQEPRALVLGVRGLKEGGAGAASRLGRLNSNVWTYLVTGLKTGDSQSGLRAYPLEAVSTLHLTATGFDFEVEVLVKAAWAGIPVRQVPVAVRYFRRPERVSHMRPVLDFLRIGHLYTKFVLLRVSLPAPYLQTRSLAAYHELPWWSRWRSTLSELFVKEPGSPGRIAASVSLGLFLGLAPIWGFQIAATLLAAHALRLSKPVAVVASHISFPLIIPFILYASLVLGRLVLGMRGEDIPPTTLELAPADFPAWVAGSLLLGAITAVIGGAATYLLLAANRRVRNRRRAA